MGKETYLRQNHKERIVGALLDRKFKPLVEANDKAAEVAALAILRAQFTDAEWTQIEAMPVMWLPRISKLRLRDEDSSYTSSYDDVDLGQSVAVPALLMGKTLGPQEAGEVRWQAYRTTVAAAKALKEERQTLKLQATALMNTFRTVEKAIEGWPEAAEVIQDIAGRAVPRQLPAITSLNAALDLPPEEGEKGS